MKIRKAVVTAAGWGTRFLPATKAQPKETLPLVDRPMIQYIVEEAVASGIEQIIIVTALGKRAIEDYFDRSFELEAFLEMKGNSQLLHEVRRISDLADIAYVRQKEQLGLGHAILTTKALIGDEPFAVFLPDDIIHSSVPCMKQLLETYERFKCSVIAVEAVPKENISSYGVIEPNQIDERISRIMNMVEKPTPKQAPSNLAIVGRYILTPEIFEELENTAPGRNGEIQLTDGLKRLLERQAIYACEFEGKRYDTGTPMGMLKASMEYALRREDIGGEFRKYLKALKEDGLDS
jgi:UTP--glucose-1-phosphate uridylyltransferase